MEELEAGSAISAKFSEESWVTRMERNTHKYDIKDQLVTIRSSVSLEVEEGGIFEAKVQNRANIGEMKEDVTNGTEDEISTDGGKGLEIAALKSIVMAEKAAAAERMAQEAEAERIAADNALVQAVAEDERKREDIKRKKDKQADAVAFVIAAARKSQAVNLDGRYRGDEFALEEGRESNERARTEFVESTSNTNSKLVVDPGSQRILCNRDTSNDKFKTKCLSPTYGVKSIARSQSSPVMSNTLQSTSIDDEDESYNLNMKAGKSSTTNAYLPNTITNTYVSTKGKSAHKNDASNMQNPSPTRDIVKTNKDARKMHTPPPTPLKVKPHTHVRQQSNSSTPSSVKEKSTHNRTPPSSSHSASSHSEAENAVPNNGYTSVKGTPLNKLSTGKNQKKGFFSLFKGNPKPEVSPSSVNKKMLPNSTKTKSSPSNGDTKVPKETVGRRTPTHKREPTPQKPTSSVTRTSTPKRSLTPQRILNFVRKSRNTSRSRRKSRSVSRGSTMTSQEGSLKSIERHSVAESNPPPRATASKGTTMKSAGGKGKNKARAVKDDIPTISNWERKADGTITGNISNAQNYEDGMTITTAPVTGRIVMTDTGHKFRLI